MKQYKSPEVEIIKLNVDENISNVDIGGEGTSTLRQEENTPPGS